MINNSEIIEKVSNDKQELYYKYQTKDIIDSYIDELSSQLKAGNDIVISGLGTFTHKTVSGSNAINVDTGEKMVTSDKHYIYFKPSKNIK